MYQLTVFVPDSHLESLKTALFAAGAGKAGHYDQCCWQCYGQGQFRALAGSRPHTGTTGQLCQISEWRVEMVIDTVYLNAVINALKAAHPYQTPAYNVVSILDI